MPASASGRMRRAAVEHVRLEKYTESAEIHLHEAAVGARRRSMPRRAGGASVGGRGALRLRGDRSPEDDEQLLRAALVARDDGVEPRALCAGDATGAGAVGRWAWHVAGGGARAAFRVRRGARPDTALRAVGGRRRRGVHRAAARGCAPSAATWEWRGSGERGARAFAARSSAVVCDGCWRARGRGRARERRGRGCARSRDDRRFAEAAGQLRAIEALAAAGAGAGWKLSSGAPSPSSRATPTAVAAGARARAAESAGLRGRSRTRPRLLTGVDCCSTGRRRADAEAAALAVAQECGAVELARNLRGRVDRRPDGVAAASSPAAVSRARRRGVARVALPRDARHAVPKAAYRWARGELHPQRAASELCAGYLAALVLFLDAIATLPLSPRRHREPHRSSLPNQSAFSPSARPTRRIVAAPRRSSEATLGAPRLQPVRARTRAPAAPAARADARPPATPQQEDGPLTALYGSIAHGRRRVLVVTSTPTCRSISTTGWRFRVEAASRRSWVIAT